MSAASSLGRRVVEALKSPTGWAGIVIGAVVAVLITALAGWAGDRWRLAREPQTGIRWLDGQEVEDGHDVAQPDVTVSGPISGADRRALDTRPFLLVLCLDRRCWLQGPLVLQENDTWLAKAVVGSSNPDGHPVYALRLYETLPAAQGALEALHDEKKATDGVAEGDVERNVSRLVDELTVRR